MKFYTLRDIPSGNDDRIFKARATGKLVASIVCLGIAIGFVVLGNGKVGLHWLRLPRAIFMYIAAAFPGLFGLLIFGQFRACLKPSNWLLRCNDNGVLIKYRSYLNWRFPADDVQVVGLDYSEIAWIRKVRERRVSPSIDGRGSQMQFFTYLDICLANADTSALEARLQAEQKVKPEGLTISLDYPVEVLPGGIIQLRWNGISPSCGKAVEYLGQHVKVSGAESTKLDLTHQRGLAPEEEKAKIIKLTRSGDKMGAVTLARQVYGYNLNEAMAFVEKLQAGDESPAKMDSRDQA